jgi:hypothetical protein
MMIGNVEVSASLMTMLILALMLWCLSDVALADEGGSHEHEHGFDFSLFSFIRPLGICALSLVLITFGTGLFRRKLARRFLKVHKALAWLAVGVALCHGILVLVLL